MTSVLTSNMPHGFDAQKQLLISARLSHRNSVRPSVTRVDQPKTVQARTTKSSPSADQTLLGKLITRLAVDMKFPIYILSISTDFPWISMDISISTDAYPG